MYHKIDHCDMEGKQRRPPNNIILLTLSIDLNVNPTQTKFNYSIIVKSNKTGKYKDYR